MPTGASQSHRTGGSANIGDFRSGTQGNGVIGGEPVNHLIGGGAALLSAFCWAVAALLFRVIGERVPPVTLNWAKGMLALLFFAAVWLIVPWRFELNQAVILLGVSGIVGIAVGDSLYFHALHHLGPRVTLLVATLVPVEVALLAAVFLDETLPPPAVLGMGITLFSVALVLWERAPPSGRLQHRVTTAGIVVAMVYVNAEAAAILLTKIGVGEVPSLQATMIRQFFASVVLTVWVGSVAQSRRAVARLFHREVFWLLSAAALLGTAVGTWLSVAALKYTHTAVATVLNATSPIFILPLVAVFFGERISRLSIGGALAAVVGIAVYFFSIAV